VLEFLKSHVYYQNYVHLIVGVFLTLWRPAAFGDFRKKNTKSHVALRGNLSDPVNATDPVKGSTDAASLLVCTRRKKNFFLGGCGFFVSDVISGGLSGHLGPGSNG